MIAKLVSFAIDMIHPEQEEAHCKPFPHYPAHIQRIPINEEFPMTEANVSPGVPEADVSMISAMFTRIADGLVQASALAKEVSELRSVVASLKSDIEYVRDQNKWLDEQLANVRRSRDETQRELDEDYHLPITRPNRSETPHAARAKTGRGSTTMRPQSIMTPRSLWTKLLASTTLQRLHWLTLNLNLWL